MKTKIKFLILFILFGLFAACSSPTNPGTSNSSTGSANPTSPSQPSSPASRANCSMTIAGYVNIDCNTIAVLGYTYRTGCYSTDSYRINIKTNPSNLQLSIAEYNYQENEIRLCSANPGTITITLYNETARVESNECEVVFQNSSGNNGGGSGNNGGDNQQPNPSVTAFIGTWTTTYSNAVINTIQFRSDGTGRCYKTGYSGENTFTWGIQNSTTLNIVNTTQNQNISSTCTYSLNGNLLILTNFFGLPQGTPITFTKN